MAHLLDIFETPNDLLRLEPEELGGILLEVIPSVSQSGKFVFHNLVQLAFPPLGGGWKGGSERPVTLALAEAVNWLTSQGLVMHDPNQHADWLVLTRRALSLKTRADIEAYLKGWTLPVRLLQPHLAEKVHHLFVRGDHDIAVFQAFKEIEVAVRKACGYGNDLVGKGLVTKAFNVDDGPLTDQSLVRAEREAEMALFVGAVGHAKNPSSHRDVGLTREEAARLIVFASHLLAIVEARVEMSVA
jgi:uncharacterized protein (TIGR02391 family)